MDIDKKTQPQSQEQGDWLDRLWTGSKDQSVETAVVRAIVKVLVVIVGLVLAVSWVVQMIHHR